jgi:transposase
MNLTLRQQNTRLPDIFCPPDYGQANEIIKNNKSLLELYYYLAGTSDILKNQKIFFQSEDKSYENTGDILKTLGLQASLNAQSTSLPDIILDVRPRQKLLDRCPICGRKGKHYDNGRLESGHWRSLDCGAAMVYLRYRVPRVTCPDHGVHTIRLPWADQKSNFTHEFEMQVTSVAQNSTKLFVSIMFVIAWATVGAIVKRVTDKLSYLMPTPLDNLRTLCIDETSYKKGHKYCLIITNMDTGLVIWSHIGFGKEILQEFFDLLNQRQRESITCVAGDGASWIAERVKANLPNAVFCLDPFHLISWFTEVVNDYRKIVYRELKEMAGQPVSSAKTKKMLDLLLSNNQRWFMIKNQEDLTGMEKKLIEAMAYVHPRMAAFVEIKELMRAITHYEYERAELELKRLITRMKRNPVESMKKLALKVERHKEGILNAVKFGISSAVSEANNNKIKVIIKMSYGFRNMQNMLSMIMLKCSFPQLPMVGRGGLIEVMVRRLIPSAQNQERVDGIPPFVWDLKKLKNGKKFPSYSKAA